MPQIESMIKFGYGLQSKYDSLSPDVNTIYFCTDTQRMFVGDVEYTRPVLSGSGAPAENTIPTNPIDILYFDTTSSEMYVSLSGAAWIKVTDKSNTTAIQSAVTALEGRMTAVETLVNTVKSTADGAATQANTNKDNIESLDGRLSTAEGEIDDLQSAVEGLTGAMHFIGTTTTELSDGATTKTITVDGVNITAAAGDVAIYDDAEYVFNGTKWSLFGDTSDFLLRTTASSTYETKTDAGNKLAEAKSYTDTKVAGKVDNTTTVNGQALSGNVNITDITGNAGTADKFKQLVKIAISGAVTAGGVDFDGSGDVTINATAVDGSKVSGKVSSAASADNATKATQDGSGNVIADTYATKTELQAAALTWTSF